MSFVKGGYRNDRRLPGPPALLLVGAALLTACVMRPPRGYPGGMRMPEMPSEEEMMEMAQAEVRQLTAGGQNPTVRRENLEHDFAVYRLAAAQQ